MITHEQLLSMWEEDAGIDKVNLDREATNIPKLHHKYLTILLDIRAKKIAYNHKLEELKKEKELYYSGQANPDDYKEKPFDLKLKTKAGVEKHVNTDPEVVDLLKKIEYMDILLEGANHILEQIKWRNSSIKSAIDWARFTSGSL
tara:strand:+ start:3956 stop:4390 length:435 start_codon:yes stop_codon:yes gene_type:complete